MKAAVGNGLLMSVIISFVVVVLLILISSIVYTKAFRIKNKIVDVIEKHEKYDLEKAKPEIEKMLNDIGYIANDYSSNSKCNKYESGGTLENSSSLFHYCIIKFNTSKSGGYYYKVVTFAYLDIPLINSIQIPVYGETRIFY